ncbi:Major facilitator superfamily domain general substrate transporter [Penicillium argentinense]|uniref:Major facilitator superfamily domain general substrate transporter n=1 Tax=Penicillium argentinense TaxID=1131581 RepID=A0A9W9KE67_9EURO|nr:Major facilitator superfamily domain general substrate transporter [Penicillium argentinense]KAJ5102571.1 Major facilitator superfamily domain general substrate transporter [Penicillium argentinense]
MSAPAPGTLSSESGDEKNEESAHDEPRFALSKEHIKAATQREQEMSIATAFRLYPKAIIWSILLSTALIMEGYDIILISSFFAFDPWVTQFGKLQSDGKHSLSAAWQSGLSNAATVGELIGLVLNGFAAERFGYRKTMIGALGLITAFIFIPFFATNVKVLLAGEVLMGIPLGVFQALPVSYASEVCPVALRGYLATYINVCWVMGELLASGVLRALLRRTDQWSYRIPYALQWMWPVPLIVGIAFAPESPWWQIRHGHTNEAKASLRSLTARNVKDAVDIDATVEVMMHTNRIEVEASKGATYADCFRAHNLRRTEIACLTSICGCISGFVLMSFSAYFFEQAGMDPSNAFDITMAQYAIGIVGILLAWLLMIRAGRRHLYVSGLFLQFWVLLGVGITGTVGPDNHAAPWGSAALLILFSLIYQSTVGPTLYAIISEISSVRLRAKTVSLSWNVYNIAKIVCYVLVPYMMNPTAWNWKAKSGFFWAGVCLLCFIWSFFRLPETKGRTYAEIDILFEQRVSARKFATTSVDLFSREPHAELLAS